MASEKLEIIIGAKDKASGVIKGISGTLGKMAKIGAGIALGGITAATAAVGGLTVAMAKLGEEGAKLQGVEDAFYSLGDRMGIVLADMKAASDGLAKETDLMKNYTDAALLVSKPFANELPRALESLSKIAAATGDNVDYLMQSFVTGIGRESPLILDNLRIQMGDMTDVVARWASENRDAALAMVDHTDEIADNNSKLQDLQADLAIAIQRQAEFTKETKESTKMSTQRRIEELRQRIAELKGGIGDLADTTREFTEDELKQMIEGMTEEQRKMILAEDALRKLEERASGLPAVVNPIQQLKVGLGDTYDTLKKTIHKMLMPFLERVVPKILNFLDVFRRFVLLKDHFEDVYAELDKLPRPLQTVLRVAREVFRFFETLFARGLGAALSQLGATIRNAIGDEAYNKLLGFIAVGRKVIDFIRNQMIPWLREKIPQAIQFLRDGWDLLSDKVGQVIDWLVTKWEELQPRIMAIRDAFVTGFLPHIQELKTYITTQFLPTITTIIDSFSNLGIKTDEISGKTTSLTEKFSTLGGFLSGAVKFSLSIVNLELAMISASLQVVLEIVGMLIPKVKEFKESIFGVGQASKSVGDWLSNLADTINRLARSIATFDLGVWEEHSPSPFEQSVRNTIAAMDELAAKSLPKLGGSISLSPAMATATAAPVTAGARGGSTPIIINYSPTFSAASRQEFEAAIVPVIDRAMTSNTRRRVERRR